MKRSLGDLLEIGKVRHLSAAKLASVEIGNKLLGKALVSTDYHNAAEQISASSQSCLRIFRDSRYTSSCKRTLSYKLHCLICFSEVVEFSVLASRYFARNTLGLYQHSLH